jgi:hypothetical protein
MTNSRDDHLSVNPVPSAGFRPAKRGPGDLLAPLLEVGCQTVRACQKIPPAAALSERGRGQRRPA